MKRPQRPNTTGLKPAASGSHPSVASSSRSLLWFVDREEGRLEAPPRVFFSFIEKKGRTLGLFSTTSFSLFCIKEKGGEERAALKAAQAPSFLLYLLFLSIKKKKKEEKRGARSQHSFILSTALKQKGKTMSCG